MNLEKFTDRAKGFLQSAQTVAIRLNHQRITPEHILKALLEDNEGMAAGLIQRAGGNVQTAQAKVDEALAKIEAALRRIDDGSYGFCEETGEPIGLKRLEARPIATLSVEAQELREKSQRGYRDDA